MPGEDTFHKDGIYLLTCKTFFRMSQNLKENNANAVLIYKYIKTNITF